MKFMNEIARSNYFDFYQGSFMCLCTAKPFLYSYKPTPIVSSLPYLNKSLKIFKSGAYAKVYHLNIEQVKFWNNYANFRFFADKSETEEKLNLGDLLYFDIKVCSTGILFDASSRDIEHYEYHFFNDNNVLENDNFEDFIESVELYEALNDLCEPTETLSQKDKDKYINNKKVEMEKSFLLHKEIKTKLKKEIDEENLWSR